MRCPEAESAQTNILYLVMNDETSHYDIYAKVDSEMVLLDDTTVGPVQTTSRRTATRCCRTTTTPDAEKSKLAGIAEGANNYVPPLAHRAV